MPAQEPNSKEGGHAVKLYVYDLSQGMASALSQQFVGRHFEGIWHTAIVVFGKEYFFGGGIQTMTPGSTPYGTPVKIVDLGNTTMEKEVFETFVDGLARNRFRVDKYHLFDNNCNHFTEEASQFLLGKSIPEYIRKLPTEFFTTPLGQMIRPMVDQLMGGSSHPVMPTAPASTQPAASQPAQTQQPASVAAPLHSIPDIRGGNQNTGAGSNPLGALGGMDLNQMMQNPMVQQMAQQMMQNMGGGSGGFGGGFGGSNPLAALGGMDLNQMMQNPMVQQMAQQMMQNRGGAGGFGGFGGFGNTGFGNTGYPTPTPTPAATTTQQPAVWSDNLEITRYKTANVPQVMKKLKATVKECGVSLSAEEEASLDKLEQYLVSEKKELHLIQTVTYATISNLLQQIPEPKVFPVLDILRLMVLSSAIVQHCTKETSSPLPLLTSWIKNWAKLTNPTQLMILRVYCNMFNASYSKSHAQDFGAQYIVYESEERLSSIVDMITSALSSALEGVRLTAASLACNIALHSPKTATDAELQLLSSSIERMNLETNADVTYRLLLTIYRLVQENETSRETALALEANFSKFTAASVAANIQGVAKAIKKILGQQ